MTDDAAARSRARALASPLRMRILRLCLHDARTNKELADILEINPGTLLHHVRFLVDTGYLRAEEPRKGTRGAREVPYRATRLSWTEDAPPMGSVLLDTFLREIEGLPHEALMTTRLGLKLNQEHREHLLHRFFELFQEAAALPADDDGEPISLFFVEHPDLPRPWTGPTAQ